ncbi:pyridoxamine 5'-phosphate oxidase family protein [Plectonema cf. radiosum LEGE 06105]|uniref:Pyridoxamine 5'-phosphate oxidase family protein n=1 Tax=Plectonema cf. radiosum LEGE 06105 TaxID=945769 RepID=A0A8J7EZK3_9CYAN|nr:pyridoxamine 5'-phosphate oxidase family protein [Plectonema radiosum]MBE9211620.1 pyridoxamine 5'-phosphate oxidase family protein [Plectonema cf. radiosum LEGE 06105]
MKIQFSEIITSTAQLREVMGYPSHRVIDIVIPKLDKHCRAFIAKSPLLFIASSNSRGNMDISPKGDPPGFVKILDDNTLAIPDRPGNRRADTFQNILENSQVGLIFLVPGKGETLRISGSAMIVRDIPLRESMAMNGKIPNFALIVNIKEAFFHCAKCMLRSKVWQSENWESIDNLPSLAQTMIDAANLKESVEEIQSLIEQDERFGLY